MADTIDVHVIKSEGTMYFGKVMHLGSEYTLVWHGLDDGETVEVIVTDCAGTTLAASVDGVMHLRTEDLAWAWPANTVCPSTKTFHVYAVAENTVLASGFASIRWTPLTFSPLGLPISLKGDDGEDGASAYESWLALPGNAGKSEAEFVASLKGEKGAKGDRGESGAYTPIASAYAFQVSADTPGFEDGHLLMMGYDEAVFYATDAQGQPILDKPIFTINSAGHLCVNYYGDAGATPLTVDIGNVRGPTGRAFTYDDFTPEQLAELKGEPGENGLDGRTYEQVAAQVEAYNYATKAYVSGEISTATDGLAQESAVNAALAGKQDVLTFDAVPTAGHGAGYVVSSGALKTVVDGLEAKITAAAGANMDDVKAMLAQILTDVISTVPAGFDDQRALLQTLIRTLKGETGV